MQRRKADPDGKRVGIDAGRWRRYALALGEEYKTFLSERSRRVVIMALRWAGPPEPASR